MSSTKIVASGRLAPDMTADAADLTSSIPFLTSTFGHVKASASNATSFLNLSPRDLLLAVPRMIARAGSFAFITLPERLDSLLGLRHSGSVIAEATGGRVQNISPAALSGSGPAQGTAAVTAAEIGVADGPSGGMLSHTLSFQQVRNFGGVFTYMTSKWALGCFTLAIVLNRTEIYASSRRHLNLTFPLRLALRIVPIVMFIFHARSLLQAMRCQSSPDFSYLKYGKADKHIGLDFARDGGLLYYLSSTMLFWQSDQDSCLAATMIQSGPEAPRPRGSLSLLWPLFQSLCLSQFIETISCAVQGRPLMTETGMSIFEHSLAFAEAEAMISNQLGLSPFGPLKTTTAKNVAGVDAISEKADFVTKSVLFERLNTPPEVLLMGLISCLNNLSSHVLGVLNVQSRFRLVNTGIWGLCFMSSFVWGFFNFKPEASADAVILRFPTVCIVGFIPHLLLIIGICMCACIYFLALLLSILAPPAGSPPLQSWSERFGAAQENLQANAQLSSIRLNMHEDFYTALLKVGFTALTVASEAVYLNEGRPIGVGRWTWLEEERLKELERVKYSSFNIAQNPTDDPLGMVASGVSMSEDRASQPGNVAWKSGYARERTTKILKSGAGRANARMGADGVGAFQRSGRYVMVWEFFTGIFWLVVRWLAICAVKGLRKAGITRIPGWMKKLSHNPATVTRHKEATRPNQQQNSLDFWLLSNDGVLSLPENDNVDVEVETKRRLRIANDRWGEEEEKTLDSTLYGWWTHGGWWGERDESGTYQPPSQDDDTTSVVSMSTYQSDVDWETDNDEDGSTTPTQRHPHPFIREPSPIVDYALDPSQLARLLDPKNPEQRLEARMLAHHLNSDRIVTRSQYRHAQDSQKARVLTSTRYRPTGLPSGKLSPHEEAEVLEHLLLTHRSKAASSDPHSSSTWHDGAEGLGAGGPQCVVCQSSPRTVLAWPCRCLSLCEDCRVSLAMNNFGTCVCCRQDVVGFSRLFVP